MALNDFFLIFTDEFHYSDIIPNYKTLFLWFKPEEKKIRMYFPMDITNVTRLNVDRRVQSVIRTGYIHPSGIRVGLGFTIETVERYENFAEERVVTEDSNNITPVQWLQVLEEKTRKLNGAKIKELELPAVDVLVKVFANTFEVYDKTTNVRLNKVNFFDEAHLETSEMLGNQKGFKITTSEGEVLQYKFDVFKQLSVLSTDALLLIKLIYDPLKNRGLYFGSFEIGEYTINKATGELEIITKYSDITHAYSYLITEDQKLLIGFQSGHLRYINWSISQALLWETTGSAPASIHSLTSYENYFVAGLNDGTIHLFKKKDGSSVISHNVLELAITKIASWNQYVICGDELGNSIKCFDLDREIPLWEVQLKKGKFVSLDVIEDDTVVFTEKGYKFTIQNNTGSVKEQNLGYPLTCKPVQIANWQILGSNNSLLYGQILPTMDRHELEFSRISQLVPLSDGLLVSTLEGKISFMKKVVMEKVQ